MSFVKTIQGEVRHGVSKKALKRKIHQAAVEPLGGTVSDDFVMKNGYLYTVVRAISARVNQNYDGWPSDELRTSAHTFVGKPVFVNHQNADPTKARGRVVAARYVENGNDKYIECIQEIDAQRFPLLAHEIRTGGLDSVSMGAEAGHTICSMCGNRATDTHDMCDHVKFHKGEHLMKNGKPQLVFESCHKLGFFELSYVFDPADETAVVSKVIQASVAPAVGQDPNDTFGDEYLDMFYNEGHDQDWRDIKPDFLDLMYGGGRGAARTAAGGGPGVIRPYKERVVDPNIPAWIYRNLADKHNGLGKWSVMQNNLVMGHGDDFHMTGRDGGPVEFVVRPGGFERANEEQQKNVHAFFKGFIDPGERPAEGWRPIQYDYKRQTPAFFDTDTDENVMGAARTWLSPQGAFYQPAAPGEVERREAQRVALHQIVASALTDPNTGEVIGDTDRVWPSVRDALEENWGSVDNWLQWVKDRADPKDPKYQSDDRLDQKAQWIKDNDERFLYHGKAAIMAAIKRAYGEVEAPESVDTLRDEEPGSEEDFHSYVETPAELRDPNLDRTQQLDREQESEGLDNDRVVEDVEGWEAPDHAQNEQQRQPLRPLGAVSPVNTSSSPMNEGRAREDSTMGRSRSSLASRGKDAKQGHQQHRKVAEGPLTDGGDQSVNAQSTREPGEEEFITPTPPEEAVEVADGGSISNTENNLVARIQHNQQQLLRDAARYQQMQADKQRKTAADPTYPSSPGAPLSDPAYNAPGPGYGSQGMPGGVLSDVGTADAVASGSLVANRRQRIAHKIAWMQQKLGRQLTADESAAVATSVPETADVVNPALSGTDDQSLKGSDFQPADPNAGVQQTQPQDSRQSSKIWSAFDGWLHQETGRTARQIGNEKYVLRQAKRFAQHYGFNPQLFFPHLGNELRQIRRANMQRQADTSLDLAAPGGRIDVEAPTSNTTDAEAQASQFPPDAFGRNAGDGISDPDLSTDYVTWAPGEGKKEGFKRASTAAAVRCADLWVESGLKPKEERYNLIASHEQMRAGQVADRIAMLELIKQARTDDHRRFAAAQRRVANGISRGATPAGIPAGLTGALRTAGTRKVSALEDQSTDGLLFM